MEHLILPTEVNKILWASVIACSVWTALDIIRTPLTAVMLGRKQSQAFRRKEVGVACTFSCRSLSFATHSGSGAMEGSEGSMSGATSSTPSAAAAAAVLHREQDLPPTFDGSDPSSTLAIRDRSARGQARREDAQAVGRTSKGRS